MGEATTELEAAEARAEAHTSEEPASRERGPAEGAPRFLEALGFVVIGRNEGARLVRALGSVRRLWPDAPAVYVDSGSTDASVQAARALGVDAIELDPSRPFSAARARNAGFTHLRERHPGLRYVQFMDGDCELEAGWIERAVTELASDDAKAVVSGRRAERHPDASLFDALMDLEWDTPVGEASAVLGDMCLRVDAFERVGGFAEHIIAAEDDDLCIRLRRLGFEVHRLDAPMTIHEANITRLSEWYRRARRAGHAYAQVHHEHRRGPERVFEKQLRSAALYGGLLPLGALLAPPLALPAGLVLGAAMARAAARRLGRGDPPKLAAAHAFLLYTSKVPELVGAAEFHARRLLDRAPEIIEYKGPAPRAHPRERLRVGIVGAGYISAFHARAALRDPRATLVAVCDLNEAAAKRLAASHADAWVYRDVERMLREARLDVVHVLTQPESHFPIAKRALEAGCHVVLEKPVADSSARAEALLELARAHDRVVTVDHNFVFARPVERLRRAVARGELGPLESVRVVWKKPLPQSVSGPWNLWMLREPRNALLETATHPVSVVLSLLDALEIQRVEARRPRTLPSGATFYRRVEIGARAGRVDVQIEIHSEDGHAQHFVEAEGLFGVARADLEGDVFSLERTAPDDGARLREHLRLGATRVAQAARTYASYGASKFSRRPTGSPYESSLLRGLASCHAAVRGEPARRESSLEFAVAVTRTVEAIAERLPERPARAPRVVHEVRAEPRTEAKLVVVGASGFIGKHLLAALRDDPRGVRAVVRDASSLMGVSVGAAGEVLSLDFREEEKMRAALEGAEAVVHLAVAHGKSLDDYRKAVVLPTLRLARLCQRAGVRRFVYVGTIDSLDLAAKRRLTEADGLDPRLDRRNNYARSKGLVEERLMELHAREGFPLVVVRPGIVLGAGGPLTHAGIARWSGLGRCELHGDGRTPLPIVLVEDVARALALAVDAEGIEGRAYNLSSEPCITARDYVDELGRALGTPIEARPGRALAGYAGDLAKWGVKLLARHPDMHRIPSLHDWRCREQRASFDVSAAREDLGWEPVVDRDEIVERGIRAPARAYLED